MDQSRMAVSRSAVKLVLAVLTIFAVLCFTLAGVSILENGTPTARINQHQGPSLPG
jgi:hypothetical protein